MPLSEVARRFGVSYVSLRKRVVKHGKDPIQSAERLRRMALMDVRYDDREIRNVIREGEQKEGQDAIVV